jgi:WD40-like Beta Propeller Repeat/RTX calcium-binding nonapeptide repeat (4 copies)
VVAAVLLVFATLALGRSEAGNARVTFTGVIVFERDAGQGSDLYVSRAPGEAAPLVATKAQEFDPALSRKKGSLAFARSRGKSSDIRALVAGTERLVTSDAAIDIEPAWSPNESMVVYARNAGQGFDLATATVGKPSSVKVLRTMPGDDITPSWSPDSRRIVWAGKRYGTFDLYMLILPSRVSRLTRTSDADFAPEWSPDQRQIAFTRANRKGNEEIYVLTIADGSLRRLTTNPATDSNPAWSPDGTTIAFVSDRSGSPAIWTVPAKGGHATPFSKGRDAVDLGPTWGRVAPSPGGARGVSALHGLTCPIGGPYLGTSSADSIDGGVSDDVICSLGGNDTVHGRGGQDKLAGGDGSDHVYGDAGNDYLVSGGNGGDYVYGGYHSDAQVSGGSSADVISGGYGDDKIFNYDAYSDRVDCGPGNDRRQADSSPSDAVANCEGYIP